MSELFNRDLPSVASRKWLFLTDRKIWKKELFASEGTLLSVAQDIIHKDRPPSNFQYSPEFLLSLLPATAKLLPAGQHRLLYNRVANYFLIHHKAFIPYTIPVKIPLISESEQSLIRARIHTVIDTHSSWPPALKLYIRSCIRIIVARSRSVGDILMRSNLRSLCTPELLEPCESCDCHKRRDTPGFSFHKGHMVFRDPALLTHFHRKLNPAVFSQNMKNATLPAWNTLKDHVNTAFQGIFSNLPDTRFDTSVDLVCALQSVCQSGYTSKILAADKRVYEPHLQQQRKYLPQFLVMSPMDKAPQIPIFACQHFWGAMHSETYFSGGRYRELFRFATPHDAAVATSWSLIDSMSPCTPGKPCTMSSTSGWSPLIPQEQINAFRIHKNNPPSRGLRLRVSKQIDCQLRCLTRLASTSQPWHALEQLGFSKSASVKDLRLAIKPPRILARTPRP